MLLWMVSNLRRIPPTFVGNFLAPVSSQMNILHVFQYLTLPVPCQLRGLKFLIAHGDPESDLEIQYCAWHIVRRLQVHEMAGIQSAFLCDSGISALSVCSRLKIRRTTSFPELEFIVIFLVQAPRDQQSPGKVHPGEVSSSHAP